MRTASLTIALLVGLMIGLSPVAFATPLTVEITSRPNHISTVLGAPVTVDTKITNTGSSPTGTLLAHLNVASLERNIYVDPEDWSSERSQELALQPGDSATLSWELQAVNSGTFAAYIVVLPDTDAVGERLVVSPMTKIDVARRPTLTAAGTLPVVLAIPLLLGLWAAAPHRRQRRRSRAAR